MAIVKPEFTLFQMQIEQMGPDTTPFGQPDLGCSPKAFDAVDVNTPSSGKHVIPVMDSMVLAVAHVHQPIVAPPAIVWAPMAELELGGLLASHSASHRRL
jgi:hypothetical protein